MKTYEKTPNLYARFKEKPNIGRYDTSKFMCDTFIRVRPGEWEFTEKVDGMNLRIILRRNEFSGEIQHEVRGRSDRAQIPGDLIEIINEMIHNRREKLDMLVPQTKGEGVTMYGEGYGPGIQKNGGHYRAEKGFILFDIARWHQVLPDDEEVLPQLTQYYLQPDDVRDIAENCNLTTVPRLFAGVGLDALTKKVRDGFMSVAAIEHDGERQAEGVVAQAPGLWHWFDGSLKRLKFKLKTKDFPS